MSALAALLGALSLLVLLLWAWSAMRLMLAVTADARAASGHAVPGPSHTLPALRRRWRDPAHAPERRRVLGLTALLLGLQLLTPVLLR